MAPLAPRAERIETLRRVYAGSGCSMRAAQMRMVRCDAMIKRN